MLLVAVKQSLRISANQDAFDIEILDLIDAARQDLILSGISSVKAENDDDALIKRAITLYVKANFGFDNPDHDRLIKAYEMLKTHLSLSGDYTSIGGEEA